MLKMAVGAFFLIFALSACIGLKHETKYDDGKIIYGSSQPVFSIYKEQQVWRLSREGSDLDVVAASCDENDRCWDFGFITIMEPERAGDFNRGNFTLHVQYDGGVFKVTATSSECSDVCYAYSWSRDRLDWVQFYDHSYGSVVDLGILRPQSAYFPR